MIDRLHAELRLDEMSIDDRIDAICDHFEREWRAGRQPCIQDYLGDTAGPERSTLFVELVKVQFEYRARCGETPWPEDQRDGHGRGAEHSSNSDLVQTLNAATVPLRSVARSIAHFKLEERLGEGAFGTVWKARDGRLDRIVAVKVPRGAILDDRDAEAILREGQAAAQLKHPNIVCVHEVGREGDVAYIVSEYIDGVDLKHWLSNCRFPPADAAELCAKLADALHHAHRRGIVHQDLKPANIIVDRDGEPHITDFGLAKRLSSDASAVAAGQVLGTPAYMSPEQAAGDSGNVGPSSDLYSLGVILYELLAGVRPFQGDRDEVIARIQKEAPASPETHRPSVPRELARICLRAMEKHPHDRFADAAQFADKLRRAIGRQKPAPAQHPLQRVRQWSRREFLIGGSSAACLAGLSAYAFLRSGVHAATPTVRRVTLRTEPAGARIVFVPVSGVDGTPLPDALVDAGRSPVALDLPAGDYWVIANLPGYGFHEVLRHVPEPSESPGIMRHQSWIVQEGVVELRRIEIPRDPVHDGMAFFPGGSHLQMGTDRVPGCIVHRRAVLPFYVDRSEFTVGDFRRLADGAVPHRMAAAAPSDDAPMVLVSHDEALHLAELAGKRLPDEWEYELAATAEPPSPHIRPRVAEWTSSWPNQPPYARVPNGADDKRIGNLRVIRGHPHETSSRGPAPLPVASPYVRAGMGCAVFSVVNLGFRCARSREPRLSPRSWLALV